MGRPVAEIDAEIVKVERAKYAAIQKRTRCDARLDKLEAERREAVKAEKNNQ